MSNSAAEALSTVIAEGSMFGSFNGMPMHPLVVHAAVVLLPLSVVGLVLLVIRPRWRRTYGWLVLVGLALSVAATVVAKESGESLAAQIGTPERHAELGDVMPIIAFVLFMVGGGWIVLGWWRDRSAKAGADGQQGASPRQPGWMTALGIVAVVVAAGSMVWLYLVGDSGAKAVWADVAVGASSEAGSGAAASSSPSATSSSGAAATYTMAQVAAHNSHSDCWTAISGSVYNVTKWAPEHPGGDTNIYRLCGIDGTSAFAGQHGNQREPAQVLAEYKIGTLG